MESSISQFGRRIEASAKQVQTRARRQDACRVRLVVVTLCFYTLSSTPSLHLALPQEALSAMNTAGLPFRTLAHALTSSLRQTAPASSGRICSRILLSQSTPFSSVAAAWPRKTSPITPIGFSVFKSNIGQPSPFFLSTRLLPVSSSSSRTSSIAQFHWTRVSPATHRSEVSRSFGTGYGYRRPPPRGPFRRALDSMPGNAIIWGILGINGVIFVAWYVAVANAVGIFIVLAV